MTNNYAEYFCLIKALEQLEPHRDEEITVFSDSKLLVNQMKGKWKFRAGTTAEKYLEAKELAGSSRSSVQVDTAGEELGGGRAHEHRLRPGEGTASDGRKR